MCDGLLQRLLLQRLLLQRLLPMEGQNDIFPAPKRIISLTDKVFTIRPFLPEDKVRLFLLMYVDRMS